MWLELRTQKMQDHKAQVPPAEIYKGARRDIGKAGKEDDFEDKEDEDKDEKVWVS